LVQSGRKRPKEKGSEDIKTSLHFLSLNAHSVVNKMDLLQATALDLKPDVIGITKS